MYLAKNLKHLRLKSGLSQEYLAKRFGYKSYTTIQKWESGAAPCSRPVLYRIVRRAAVVTPRFFPGGLAAVCKKVKKGHKKIPRSLGSGYIDRDLGVYLTPDRISYLERGQLVRDKGPGGLIPLGFAPP